MDSFLIKWTFKNSRPVSIGTSERVIDLAFGITTSFPELFSIYKAPSPPPPPTNLPGGIPGKEIVGATLLLLGWLISLISVLGFSPDFPRKVLEFQSSHQLTILEVQQITIPLVPRSNAYRNMINLRPAVTC